MKVAVVSDLHFVQDQAGNSYTPVMYSYNFFERYHHVFEEVHVVARGKKVDKAPENSLQVNGDGVKTVMLPETKGIKEYAKRYFAICSAMEAAISECDTAIIRIPSALSTMAVSIARKLKKPYALEVVADPYSVKPGKSLMDRLVSAYVVRSCKQACLHANGVAYVTRDFLQTICPCQAVLHGQDSLEHFTGNYSSVTLPETYFSTPKTFDGKKQFMIAHTANLIQNEAKGHSIVIRTVAKLRAKGYDVSAKFIGDGSAVEEFKKLAHSLGIQEYIHFVGKFANPQLVRDQLLASDLYLFPSESEGLPRGVIEAMACGLVCVASNVSGIPELLPAENLYDPKDVDGYAERLAALLDAPDTMAAESARNIEVAKQYSNENLTKKRNAFYGKLRKLVEVRSK